jgi:hypothetical protein
MKSGGTRQKKRFLRHVPADFGSQSKEEADRES